ncbi:hypothetical protein D1AOALGA4SA_10049 [Olavius algarvensis Delta 1 endosymbiont]|nr:hypothetical protein D1AOALGA4SA_10049 [Olavius algarvensis Delta 1 endosymbiont]
MKIGFGCQVSGVRCSTRRTASQKKPVKSTKKLLLTYDAIGDCGSGLLT